MNRALLIVSVLLSLTAFPQVGPGVWQDHTSISSCYSVTKRGERVYASYFNGLIKFDDQELSPQTMCKINGLSDIGVRLLRTNPHNNKVLVIYENSNIDILDENDNVTNYAGIKLKTFNGSKVINEVAFDRELAYLACGFGIIVFDTEKLEIKDTYIIGPQATLLDVKQVAVKDSLLFAATTMGMFKGNRGTVLNNYKNWKLDTIAIPKGYYAGVVNVEGNIIAYYSDRTQGDHDTIYQYMNNHWEKYPPFANRGLNIMKTGPVYKNLFSVFDNTSMIVWDFNTGVLQQIHNTFQNQVAYGTKRDGHISKNFSGNITHWIADSHFGLYRVYNYFDPTVPVNRNGTHSRYVANIDIRNGKVAVSPSYIKNTGNGNYLQEGINVMENQEWKYIPCLDADGDPIQDVTWVFYDRIDKKTLWAASLTYGIMKFQDNKIVQYYNPGTTPGMPVAFNSPKYATRCTGISSDKDGNIWFSHAGLKDYLSVIKKNGQYQNFAFDRTRGYCRKTFVDKNNYVWMLHEDGEGITVFNHKNFSTPVGPAESPLQNFKILTNTAGEGNLESKEVYSIAEDKDGKIWVGTAKGISVFYNTAAIFGGGNFDAQPIKIVQDGNVELLLSKEIVSAIVVDGANNKWVGTMQGGVYCFSPDGLKEIHHFTKESSALYSNTILDLAYDEVTGDVFIASDAGVQSYRGIIVAGEEKYSDVYAYPNPVKPNYQGTVLIRGLMDNSVVKITDESGNMVWEAKSTGGQIEWPLQTFAANRVTSGVYVVYASTTNGEFKASAKILVIN